MSVPTRAEKVTIIHSLALSYLDQTLPRFLPLQWKKGETRYIDREWTAEEVAAFEDGILHHGPELRAVRDEVGTRTVPEVVRFYGRWKKYVSKFAVPFNFFHP